MDSSVGNDSLYHLSTTGANYVAIVVTQYQMNISSTEIFPIYNEAIRCSSTPYGYCSTVTDTSLINTINNAHAMGLKVLLKPHIDLINDSVTNWRGDIGNNWDINTTSGANNWNKWFESYSSFILHYASIANNTNIELFSVSTELITASTIEQQWRILIPKIRDIYTVGLLTDAANWSPPNTNTSQGEFVMKKWWDLVDIIGCDEYYIQQNKAYYKNNDTNNTWIYPNIEQLLNIWKPIEAQMEYIHNKWNKSIIFTEIGYCSGVNATCFANKNFENFDNYPIPTNESLYAQTQQYEAMFLAMGKYDWFKGVFWWNWATDAAFGGKNNSCMDPKFKPTEMLLRKWYNATQDMPDVPDYPPTCKCWL